MSFLDGKEHLAAHIVYCGLSSAPELPAAAIALVCRNRRKLLQSNDGLSLGR